MLDAVMLSFLFFIATQSVIMLHVVTLNVVAPVKRHPRFLPLEKHQVEDPTQNFSKRC
jgi:hypothetical protein